MKGQAPIIYADILTQVDTSPTGTASRTRYLQDTHVCLSLFENLPGFEEPLEVWMQSEIDFKA